MLKRLPFSLLGMLVAVAACAGPGSADEDSSGAALSPNDNAAIVVKDGETQPIYVYSEAIRESVYVESRIDSDNDGVLDRIAVSIVRPRLAPGRKVAIVMEASPYYRVTTPAAAHGIQIPGPGPVPLGHRHWHDQFFVERGYATVEVEMQGTARSKGCPTTGAPADTASIVAAVDWLNGRAKAFDSDNHEVVASWSTGKVGMMGLSYNGTLPIAVAAEGVQGLETIVPMGAISSWYDYTRDAGIGFAGWDHRYPEMLANFVVSNAAESVCAQKIKALGDDAGDDSFDFTPFWQERDYRKNLDRIHASVFIVHGLRDWNVKMRQFGKLWDGLAARGVPRKIWLHRQGHTDPVRVRPAEWKTEIHHWMDHWLYGVANGVMREPMASVQREDQSWADYSSWPERGTSNVSFHFTAGGGLERSKKEDGTQRFTDDPTQKENVLIADPEAAKPFRLAYLTPPLAAPVRLSGTAQVKVTARIDAPSSPLSAVLVDYGTATVREADDWSFDELMRMECSLTDVETRRGCAAPPQMPLVPVVKQVVSRGTIDVKNRSSLMTAEPIVAGSTYTVQWELQPNDWVFAAGHRIGVVISANNASYAAVDRQAGAVTVDLAGSELILPVAP